MLIIDKGKKVVEGKVEELLNPSETDVEIEAIHFESALEKLRTSSWGQYLKTGTEKKILLRMKKNSIPHLIKDISEMDIPLISIRPRHSLEDYFLSLTAN
jgi:hypothetical protein